MIDLIKYRAGFIDETGSIEQKPVVIIDGKKMTVESVLLESDETGHVDLSKHNIRTINYISDGDNFWGRESFFDGRLIKAKASILL